MKRGSPHQLERITLAVLTNGDGWGQYLSLAIRVYSRHTPQKQLSRQVSTIFFHCVHIGPASQLCAPLATP